MNVAPNDYLSWMAGFAILAVAIVYTIIAFRAIHKAQVGGLEKLRNAMRTTFSLLLGTSLEYGRSLLMHDAGFGDMTFYTCVGLMLVLAIEVLTFLNLRRVK